MESSEGQKPPKVRIIGGKNYTVVDLDKPDPRGEEYWKATTPQMVSEAVGLVQPKTKQVEGKNPDAMTRRVQGFRGQK